jgi:hypothetical protein
MAQGRHPESREDAGLMAAPSTASASHLWYVQAAGQVWGPYTEARMADFLAEGRVGAATLVSPWRAGPFTAARDMLQPSATAPATPSVTQAIPVTEPALANVATHKPGPGRPLLVWAGVAESRRSAFQASLSGFGPWAQLRPGLWLVRAGTDAAGLRNALSRGLAATEALLVVEAPLASAAWFNLAQTAERELRQFWGG